MKWIVFSLIFSVGCAGKSEDDTPACSNEGLTGLASVEMDGDAWAADSGSWNTTGSGVQINLKFDGPNRSMNVRGTRDQDGVDISDRLDVGDFPINVSLSGEDGTGSIIDGRFNRAYASNEASGNLTILDLQGVTMSACFSFTAVSDDSTKIEVVNGMAEVDEL